MTFAWLAGCNPHPGPGAQGTPENCHALECLQARAQSCGPAPTRTEGLPMGYPCSAASECQPGLVCEFVQSAGQRSCSTPCDQAECPVGSVCIQSLTTFGGTASLEGNRRMCMPGCQITLDCASGIQSACQSDQATDTLYCAAVSCFSEGDCASGYQCVGRRCAGPGSDGPDFPGYCEKT